MIYLDEDTIRASLPWAELAEAVEKAITESSIVSPDRQSYQMASAGATEPGRLLIMPCWDPEESVGLKTVTYRPDNQRFGLATHGASYILINPRTGKVQAVLEAHELTARRTAVVSALAARSLARSDAKTLLVVGTGPVACAVASAYSALFRLSRILVFGRSEDKVGKLLARLSDDGVQAHRSVDLAADAYAADIISMATSSHSPLLRGEWLSSGTHVDLIGSFTPDMREVDDDLLARSDEIWVDTLAAVTESGDLVGPMASGVITAQNIRGDLRHLLATRRRASRPSNALTVFKAVGFATGDLAAAQLALKGNVVFPVGLKNVS